METQSSPTQTHMKLREYIDNSNTKILKGLAKI